MSSDSSDSSSDIIKLDDSLSEKDSSYSDQILDVSSSISENIEQSNSTTSTHSGGALEKVPTLTTGSTATSKKIFSSCNIAFYLIFFFIHGSFRFASLIMALNYLNITCGINMVLQLPYYLIAIATSQIVLSVSFILFFILVIFYKNTLHFCCYILMLALNLVCHMVSIIFTILCCSDFLDSYHPCASVMLVINVFLIINMIVNFISIPVNYIFYLQLSN